MDFTQKRHNIKLYGHRQLMQSSITSDQPLNLPDSLPLRPKLPGELVFQDREIKCDKKNIDNVPFFDFLSLCCIGKRIATFFT